MLAASWAGPLCQGAALHYVNGRNGVKDFDVWSFYAQYNDWPFPARGADLFAVEAYTLSLIHI